MKTNKNQRKYIADDLDSMANAVNYYSWLIDIFGDYIDGHVLEVGAGSGTFSKFLLDKSKCQKLSTVEPAKEVFELQKSNLSEYSNVNHHHGFLNEVKDKFEEKFNSVVYINVLEHVEDDFKEMEHCADVLEPGGHACIYVPAMQSIYGEFDKKVGHYRRYSKSRLKEVLENAGFELKSLNYSDVFGILPWLLNFRILKKEDLSHGSVKFYDKFMVPIIKFIESLMHPPIGKNLWAVAQKV